MLQTVTNIVKWVSIPVLLIASLFSFCAASYEPFVQLGICMIAVILVQRAIRLNQYFWASGLAAIFVFFSPIPLLVKLFLLAGITCIAAFVNLVSAFRTQPAPVA
jgi:hypothetical protein